MERFPYRNVQKKSADKCIVFPGKEDQSRNPLSSSRVIYFQGGSACEYTINAFTIAHNRKKHERNNEERITFCIVIMSANI